MPMLLIFGSFLLLRAIYIFYRDIHIYLETEDYWCLARLFFAFVISIFLIILGAIYGK